MIFDYFKISGTGESLFDFNDILRVLLKSDKVQGFDTSWDEVLLSMRRVPEEEMLNMLTNTSLLLRGIELSRDIVPPGRRCRDENRPLMLD